MLAEAAALPPAVKVMIVGRAGDILRGPQRIRAGAARVRVRGRSCAVAAGTPLAALEATHLRISLRDYGSCSARPRDGASLFVTAVGAQRNSGRNGWVYKLNGRVASTGAADPAGAFGSNSTLTWFWCNADRYQHCQPTLAAALSAKRVGSGARIGVRVAALDDMGRARAAAGATVSLGGVSWRTGRDGGVVVTAPLAPGRYTLTVSSPGTVQAMPSPVRVL